MLTPGMTGILATLLQNANYWFFTLIGYVHKELLLVLVKGSTTIAEQWSGPPGVGLIFFLNSTYISFYKTYKLI